MQTLGLIPASAAARPDVPLAVSDRDPSVKKVALRLAERPAMKGYKIKNNI